ncbi:hypothetical protein ACFLYL_01865 [Chloroflexota bacterium]
MDYITSLEVAQNLESIKRFELKDKPVVKSLAHLICNYGILDLQYLNGLVESLLTSGKEDEPTYFLTPDTLLRRELLGEDLAPWAQKIRKRIFGKVETPFPDYDSAVEWIKLHNVTMTPYDGGNTSHSLEPCRTCMGFSDADGNDESAYPRIGSPLEKIIFACFKLTKKLEIGLDSNSLVFFVLNDTIPFISPIEWYFTSHNVELPSGKKINYREANFKIRDDFNPMWLKFLDKKVREGMLLTKKKKLTAKHLQLYRLVCQKGGPPKGKGTVAFWESTRAEWNTNNPKDKYNTWKAIKIGYDRIISKLSATTHSTEVVYHF